MNKNISRLVGVGLLISALSGCPEKIENSPENIKPINVYLKVGESYFADFMGISYCGMNSEKTFSVSKNYNYSTNLFYPISTKELILSNRKFEVKKVTPEEIELVYLGKANKLFGKDK